MNIRSVTINNLTGPALDVFILWKRGAKSIDTKVKKIGENEGNTAIFNEKFQMKTAIEWDSLRNKFGKKKSILAVFTKDKQ